MATPDRTYSYEILVGPPRHEEDGGKLRLYPGFVYRVQMEHLRSTGISRLSWIDGPVAALKSVREPGESIEDYALDARRPPGWDQSGARTSASRVAATHGEADAWYAPVFEDDTHAQVYDHGHLVAAQFGGPTQPLNMAPQLASVNRRSRRDGRWNDIERQMRRLLLDQDVIRVGGEVRRRKDFPDRAQGELVKRGQGQLRVTLAYTDDEDTLRARIPSSFCLGLGIFGASGLVAHASNTVISDLGARANQAKKLDRKLGTQRSDAELRAQARARHTR